MKLKRFLTILLTAIFLLSVFVSCGGDDEENVSSPLATTPNSENVSSPSKPASSEKNSSEVVPSSPGVDSSSEKPASSLPNPSSSPEESSVISPAVSSNPENSSSNSENDSEFDLVPTGVFTKKLALTDLYSGSLVLVGNSVQYPASLTGFPLIRTNRTSNIQVSTYFEQITPEALEALDALEIAFKKETESALNLVVKDSFPYSKAEELLKEGNNTYITTDEHYTGLAFHMFFYDGKTYPLNYSSLRTESNWMSLNVAKYGFVFRYTAGKESITGMPAEVNHLRYVGIPHAAYMYQNNLCLEEYLMRIQEYGPDNRLVVTDFNGNKWSVYYINSESSGATVILPKGVSYQISGNGTDGYIISAKSVWEGALTDMIEKIPVSEIEITAPATASVSAFVGNTFSVKYKITPENATNQKVVFSSSNDQVASVSKDGLVEAISSGNATITVTAVDGSAGASLEVVVKENTAPTVWLDAGHGCYNSKGILDIGAGEGTPFYDISGGLYESDLNMQITNQVKEILLSNGYNVLLTRENDRQEYVPVKQRAEEANKAMADVFVSVHANSAESKSAEGARVYYYEDHAQAEKCLKLNQAICQFINSSEGCSASKVIAESAEYTVLTQTQMPSVLVETCFLTNEQDAQKAVTAEWCTKMATAIAEGIMQCYPIA